MHDPARNQGLWPAVLTAVALLLLSQGGYWLLAQQLARPGDSAPLPAGTLAHLPQRIGDWAGYDVPLDQALVAATSTDDHLYRTYHRHTGADVVGLYIAYGIKGRDLMPHRPEVCYPSAGWTQRSSDGAQILLADGTSLDCTIYEFSRSGLLSQAIYVLNYFIVDGQYSPDVSLLRSKAWRGSGKVQYVAQVQVTCGGGALLNSEGALLAIRQFAAESAWPVRALLPAPSAVSRSPDRAANRLGGAP